MNQRPGQRDGAHRAVVRRLKEENRDELRERGLVFTTTRSAVTLAGASAAAVCAAVGGLARRW